MKDELTIKRINLLHPILRDDAQRMYNVMCAALTGRAVPRFSHTLRTIKEQDELYKIGRSIKGKVVTNAKGGQSFHNFGLAFDLVLIIDGKEASWDTLKDFDGDGYSDWLECVKIAKMYGFEWGGMWKFKDMPHFQKTFGKTTAELIAGAKIIQDNIEYPKL